MGRMRANRAVIGWVAIVALLLGIITVQAYVAVDRQAQMAQHQ